MKLEQYNPNTNYSVGDIVLDPRDGEVYRLHDPANKGTSPANTKYWGRLDQRLSDAVKLIFVMTSDMVRTGNVANNLTTTASGKVLDARQGKALKTLIDDNAADIAEIQDMLPDEKQILLVSSTASSTKVFSITVDDSGELSATEYTPPVSEG